MEICKKVFLLLVKEDFKVKKDGYIMIDVGYSTSSVAKLTEMAGIRSNIRITPQQYSVIVVLINKVSKSLSKTARHFLDQ
jgi:hydrogenase maturation factor